MTIFSDDGDKGPVIEDDPVDLGIRGKVALVTGASSGLGKACALALASEGARLGLAARREDLLAAVAREALQRGAQAAEIFACDLTDAAAVERLPAEVRSKLGEIEIVILNGGGPKAATFTKLSAAEWDEGYRLLLGSMLQLVAGVLPGMRQRKWGRIVALTSSSVKQPIPSLALSNVFRTALVAALKTLSIEVARDGITVNAIATGRILTDRLRSLHGGDDAELARAATEVPAGRIADPDEFAPLVAFLCGAPAGYVTGQTISVDGGLVGGLFG